MDTIIAIFVITIINILECQGNGSFKDNLLQILRRSLDIEDEPNEYGYIRNSDFEGNSAEVEEIEQDSLSQENIDGRRFYDFHPGTDSKIIGAPISPNQLPEAEAILPGHTLLRPALSMLKSAVKFPHKELDSGAGVYGNIDNLGLTYGGTGERVLYTGFRRSNDEIPDPTYGYVIAILRQRKPDKPGLRYTDYAKLEIENKKKMEELKKRNREGQMPKEHFMLKHPEIGAPGSDYRIKYQTYVPSGLVIQFVESPKLKYNAELADRGTKQNVVHTSNMRGHPRYWGNRGKRNRRKIENTFEDNY